jgi:hypothetical protein
MASAGAFALRYWYSGIHGFATFQDEGGAWIIIDSSAGMAFALEEGDFFESKQEGGRKKVWKLEGGQVIFNVSRSHCQTQAASLTS